MVPDKGKWVDDAVKSILIQVKSMLPKASWKRGLLRGGGVKEERESVLHACREKQFQT